MYVCVHAYIHIYIHAYSLKNLQKIFVLKFFNSRHDSPGMSQKHSLVLNIALCQVISLLPSFFLKFSPFSPQTLYRVHCALAHQGKCTAFINFFPSMRLVSSSSYRYLPYFGVIQSVTSCQI